MSENVVILEKPSITSESLRVPQLSEMVGISRHTLHSRIKAAFSENEIARSSSNQICLSSWQTRKIISGELSEIKGKVIYTGNLKGGVGKTMLSYLIAKACAALGLKTCILDLDVQANLTGQFIEDSEDLPVFFDIIDGNAEISETIVKVSDHLDLVPSSVRNGLIEKTLTVQSPKSHLRWFNEICLRYLRKNYEVIIVDTPPQLATLNSVFCLSLLPQDHMMVPICPERFSLTGVNMLLEDVRDIRKSYGVENDVNTIMVLNKFWKNQKVHLEMFVRMQDAFGDMLANTIIEDRAKIRDLMESGCPLTEIKQGKEIFSLLNSLLKDLNIFSQGDDK